MALVVSLFVNSQSETTPPPFWEKIVCAHPTFPRRRKAAVRQSVASKFFRFIHVEFKLILKGKLYKINRRMVKTPAVVVVNSCN